uniref:Uncharacterized protein n=1 Tax=Anguilla anguilla TaxID=7936 RepID=A0A0E9T2A2_ANGAN
MSLLHNTVFKCSLKHTLKRFNNSPTHYREP